MSRIHGNELRILFDWFNVSFILLFVVILITTIIRLIALNKETYTNYFRNIQLLIIITWSIMIMSFRLTLMITNYKYMFFMYMLHMSENMLMYFQVANLLWWATMIVHIKQCVKNSEYPYEVIKAKIKRFEVWFIIIFFITISWIFITDLTVWLIQLIYDWNYREDGSYLLRSSNIWKFHENFFLF